MTVLVYSGSRVITLYTEDLRETPNLRHATVCDFGDRFRSKLIDV